MESTLRTANNLLEHLHASFFFYILTEPGKFMKIGSYLPSTILISVSLMIGGLSEYVNTGWELTSRQPERWSRRSRPVLRALMLIVSTHIVGAVSFTLLSRTGQAVSHRHNCFGSRSSMRLDVSVICCSHSRCVYLGSLPSFP
jgi:GPI-anchor transamidase subunit GAA1